MRPEKIDVSKKRPQPKKEYYYLEAAHQYMSLEDVKKFGVSFNEASKVFKDFRKGGH